LFALIFLILATLHNAHELFIPLTHLCKHVREFKVKVEQPPPP